MSAPRLHTFRSLLRRPHSVRSFGRPRHTHPFAVRFVFSAAETTTTTTTSTSSPPSLLRRIASTTSLALLFTVIGFIMAAAPALDTVSHLLNLPNDAESLTLFSPSDEVSREVESFINTHPLVLSLRSNPAFSESRPHMKIPPAWRSQNLTGGTLLGPGKVIVPPLSFSENGGKSYVQICHVGTDLCGHIGIIHGGFLATLLDEGLARCCFAALPYNIGMTAKLEVNYKAPAKADQYLVLKARTTKVEGRKAWVEGHIETLPQKEGEEPVVLATAEALYISPKQAATMAKVYPVT